MIKRTKWMWVISGPVLLLAGCGQIQAATHTTSHTTSLAIRRRCHPAS